MVLPEVPFVDAQKRQCVAKMYTFLSWYVTTHARNSTVIWGDILCSWHTLRVDSWCCGKFTESSVMHPPLSDISAQSVVQKKFNGDFIEIHYRQFFAISLKHLGALHLVELLNFFHPFSRNLIILLRGKRMANGCTEWN